MSIDNRNKHEGIKFKLLHATCIILIFTLRDIAKWEFVESNCCWVAFRWSMNPFWNVESTWSNIDLHDISNAGIIAASKLDLSASCKYKLHQFSIPSKKYSRLCLLKKTNKKERKKFHRCTWRSTSPFIPARWKPKHHSGYSSCKRLITN